MSKKIFLNAAWASAAGLMPLVAAHGQAASPAPVADAPNAQAANEPNGKPSDGQSRNGEIVVTALKRRETLQKVPLAISAVSGATLATLGITDSTALSRISPGLVFRESSLSGSRITIRNIQAAGEPTVGLYYDETPIANSAGVSSDAGGTTPTIRLYDVERVEVLRGPQGTLYGSSSMAGALRLIFAKPNLTTLEGSADGQLMAVDHGNLGYEGQGMINVPVIKDMVAVRVVGFYKDQPGYIDNTALHRNDVNTNRSYGGRAMVRVQPSDNLTIDGLAAIQHLSGAISTYFLAAGPYIQNFAALQPVKDRNEIYSGTVNWNFGPAALTIVGSHSYRDFDYSYDSSPIFANGVASSTPGSANYYGYLAGVPSVANSPQVTKADSVEARLGSRSGGLIDWTAGVFYSNRRGNIASNIVQADALTGEPLAISNSTLLGQRLIYDQLKQIAGFGEATWHVTSKLSATGGLRYYKYDRVFTGEVTKVDNLVGFTAFPLTEYKTSEDGFLYKGNVAYQFTNQVMAYATVSTGERPGGVNTALGIPANVQSYKSDTLTNYEIGAKTQFLDRAVTMNAALFQMDWNNIQTSAQLVNSNFSFIANAGKARIRGVEAETKITPLPGLEFDGSASYIVAKLVEDQSNQTLLAPGLKGDPIPLVPKTTVQGGGQYSWDLNSELLAKLRVDGQYQSSSWTQFSHTSAFQRFIPAYATLNLRLGLEGKSDQWSAAIFVNNVTNNDAVVNKFTSGIYGGLNLVRAISLVPRVIGLEVSKHF